MWRSSGLVESVICAASSLLSHLSSLSCITSQCHLLLMLDNQKMTLVLSTSPEVIEVKHFGTCHIAYPKNEF
jgi:hypothetical protein